MRRSGSSIRCWPRRITASAGPALARPRRLCRFRRDSDADYERSSAWRYRDFVVRAFNADLPYDRFLELQIAGDEVIDYPSAYRSQKQLDPDQVERRCHGYLRWALDTSRPDFKQIKTGRGIITRRLKTR